MNLDSGFIPAYSPGGGILERLSAMWSKGVQYKYARLEDSIYKDWWKSFLKLQLS